MLPIVHPSIGKPADIVVHSPIYG